ncbi:MAG: radical SAM protein [Planctomycetota bacterium]
MEASYIKLIKSGELKRRIEAANRILSECTLCPRGCRVNRLKGELGFCESPSEILRTSGDRAVISSYGPHYGEEPPVSGQRGSGAIFFTGCNLRCLFCQNYQISQLYQGKETSIEDLAKAMLNLQASRCHNINLVSPTHFVAQILEALLIAAENGLELPIVYNTNGYDSLATLKLLDGIVDIYLPDIKYSEDRYAKEYSGGDSYVKYNHAALKEMFRQVGNPVMDNKGVAQKGLIIRHLVLPMGGAGSFKSLDFIRDDISKDAFISLMAQYHPCYKAEAHPILNRRLKHKEYDEVVAYAGKLGLDNCYVQALVSSDDFLPDFKKERPFD